MNSYRIKGHLVREIQTTDKGFYDYLACDKSCRRKWVSRVYCNDEKRIIELTFDSIKHARETFKMFGYAYTPEELHV